MVPYRTFPSSLWALERTTLLRGSTEPRLKRGRVLFPGPLWGSRVPPPSPTLRRYLSTISRPQLLHTHLPGGQTEPEAMDWGEDEQESSSPAPSGFTCRNSRAVAADPFSLPRPTYPRGAPQGLSSLPVRSLGYPDLQTPGAPQPRALPCPRSWGGSPP